MSESEGGKNKTLAILNDFFSPPHFPSQFNNLTPVEQKPWIHTLI